VYFKIARQLWAGRGWLLGKLACVYAKARSLETRSPSTICNYLLNQTHCSCAGLSTLESSRQGGIVPCPASSQDGMASGATAQSHLAIFGLVVIDQVGAWRIIPDARIYAPFLYRQIAHVLHCSTRRRQLVTGRLGHASSGTEIRRERNRFIPRNLWP